MHQGWNQSVLRSLNACASVVKSISLMEHVAFPLHCMTHEAESNWYNQWETLIEMKWIKIIALSGSQNLERTTNIYKNTQHVSEFKCRPGPVCKCSSYELCKSINCILQETIHVVCSYDFIVLKDIFVYLYYFLYLYSQNTYRLFSFEIHT